MANDSFALLVPKVVEPSFRSSNNTLPDILVPTCTYIDGKKAMRIFVLEQPADGFRKYNYTFIGPDIQGTEPYETEAFYVKHVYVVSLNESGLPEYSEMVFFPDAYKNAVSAAPTGVETIDFNRDGLMDLVVAIGYYDKDGSICGGEIRFFQRVQSLTYNYAFNETQVVRMDEMGVFAIEKANLDGNITNGRESLVAGISAVEPTINKPLIIYLTPNGSYFEVNEIYFENSVNPYRGVYSKPIILDGNGDGYDDVIFYCVDKEQEEGYYHHGDIVYFQNTGDKMTPAKFIFSSQYVKILMKGQSPTWGLELQQADNDPELELTVCLLNPLPFWCPLYKGEIYAYYCDVFNVIRSIA